jgi:NADPH:quinone reductase-like Zn-dependent oxidoreductase
MKAAVVTEQGLQYTDAPKPSPKPHEILIKVRAASLNRADLAVATVRWAALERSSAWNAPERSRQSAAT